MDALLAFAHHDPNTAEPLVRAGAFLIAEFLTTFRVFAKFFFGLFKKR